MPNSPRTRRSFSRTVSKNRSGDPFYCSTAWIKLRDYIRLRDPLCVECLKEGVTRPTDHIDHKIPRSVRPDLELEPENLQGLCATHHNRKTAAETGLGKYK